MLCNLIHHTIFLLVWLTRRHSQDDNQPRARQISTGRESDMGRLKTRKCQFSQLPLWGCGPVSSLTPHKWPGASGREKPGHLRGRLDRRCSVLGPPAPWLERPGTQERKTVTQIFPFWASPDALMAFPLRQAKPKKISIGLRRWAPGDLWFWSENPPIANS